jgi:AbiJ N-terminal domain 5/TIR domain
MNEAERKKASVITKYAVENFSAGDWLTVGQLTGQLPQIEGHPRLLRSLGFGDEDYEYCVADVFDKIFTNENEAIETVIEHFDIDLWYEQKDPKRYERIFRLRRVTPSFWKPGYLRAFVSHLSKSREKVAYLKSALEGWGVSSFIAHQDIEPTKEWQAEIEAGLSSMDLLVAIIEPGFRESLWTDHEVGFALGRNVDVIPLLVGEIPHGFLAKIQGIQAKGKIPSVVADELVLVLLRKPKHRRELLSGMATALGLASSKDKTDRIAKLDDWGAVADQQLKELLERSALSESDKVSLKPLINRVGAFRPEVVEVEVDDDTPF